MRPALRAALPVGLLAVLGTATAVPAAVAPPQADAPRAAAAPAGCAGTLCAGAGRGEITPPVGTPMWGYGDRSGVLNPQDYAEQKAAGTVTDTDLYAKAFRASEGVHQRLYARALVLQDREGDRVVLVQLDLGSVSEALHAAVAEQVADVVDRGRLVLAPTHTHAAAGALHGAPFHFVGFGDVYDPRTLGVLRDGTVAAVRAAAASLTPARAAVGRTEVVGATVNRAFPAHLRNPDRDPDATPEDAVDRTLTMLRVDAAGGEPLAAFTAFADHGTVEGSDNALLSGDNAGYAERLLEAAMRARSGAADPLALWANGAEGDVAPVSEGPDQYARALDNGRRQAEPATALWTRLAGSLRDDLTLDVAWDTVDTAAGRAEGFDMSVTPLYGAGGSCLPVAVPGVGAKCPMAPSGPPPQALPFQVVRVGDTALLGLPFEVTTQAARRIRAAAAAAAEAAAPGLVRHVAVVGMTNDYGGYLTTAEEYGAQRYEGQMTWWGPGQQAWVSAHAASATALAVTGRAGAPPRPVALPATADATPSQALAPARQRAGTVLAEPVAGPVLTFTWAGGDPTVDLPRGGTSLVVEAQRGAGWVEADRLDAGDVRLRFRRTADANTWTGSWAPTGPGTYRFAVRGAAYDGAGVRAYTVTSRAVVVP